MIYIEQCFILSKVRQYNIKRDDSTVHFYFVEQYIYNTFGDVMDSFVFLRYCLQIHHMKRSVGPAKNTSKRPLFQHISLNQPLHCSDPNYSMFIVHK